MINGRALKDARKAKGLSQEELGKAVGVTQQAIQKMEKGGSRPTLLIYKIAKVLEKPATYFDSSIPQGGIDEQLSELPTAESESLHEAFSQMISVVKSAKPLKTNSN